MSRCVQRRISRREAPLETDSGRRTAEGFADETNALSVGSLQLCAVELIQRQTLSGEHFHVSYPVRTQRAEVEGVLRTLEAARLDMFARAGPASLKVPDAAIDVVIHETTQRFMAATGRSWWVAGVTHGRRIELQPLNVLRRRRILTSTLRHEYAHSVIEANARSDVPRWLIEGLAITFAGEGRMLPGFQGKTRMPLDELERRLAHPSSSAEMRALYGAAYYEVQTLIRKEGEPSVWRRVGTWLTSRVAIFAVLGVFALRIPRAKTLRNAKTAKGPFSGALSSIPELSQSYFID